MRFVALIPVGPKRKELERLSDLLTSLFCFEPAEGCSVVLINDGNSRAQIRELCSRYPILRCDILDNPRDGRGVGWSDGLTVGILAGLQWIARHLPSSLFVLKLDTDSLVIGPFWEKVAEFFRRDASVGMIGTHMRQPGGAPTDSVRDWAPKVRKLQRPLTLWKMRTGWHLQCGFLGRDRRIRRLIAGAIASGYVLGESCQGGAYALSAAALQRLNHRGLLDDPFQFFNRRITEDIVVGLLTRAVDLGLADFNAEGQPFGVTWRGLCAAPLELLRRGHSIIHSVKDSGPYLERETRAYFAGVRETLQYGHPSVPATRALSGVGDEAGASRTTA